MILGLLCFIIPRFVEIRKVFLVYLSGILLFVSPLALDKLVIINDEENIDQQDYLSLLGNFDFKFKNGDLLNKSVNENLIINNTNYLLVVDKVEYGYIDSSNNNGDITVVVIPPYSSVNLKNSVDYFFKEPPQSIRVKSGESKMRYWLHKESIQSQE